MTADLSQLRVLGQKKQEAQKLGNLNDVLDCYNKYAQYSENRILVVDDEEFCISTMKVILQSLGINIDF